MTFHHHPSLLSFIPQHLTSTYPSFHCSPLPRITFITTHHVSTPSITTHYLSASPITTNHYSTPRIELSSITTQYLLSPFITSQHLLSPLSAFYHHPIYHHPHQLSLPITILPSSTHQHSSYVMMRPRNTTNKNNYLFYDEIIDHFFNVCLMDLAAKRWICYC